MSIVIFTGPSLSAADASRELDAVYLPPVSQGDVYRVALKRPRVIGIIDGVFERVPAVWHKEILWAMSKGIHVFGAASMGALRAAELADFGMVGVGQVFAAYHRGELEDDDEVAVAHASTAEGSRVLSEAMVNVRATLQAAVDAQIIEPATALVLSSLGKALFYPERSYAMIMQQARKQGVAPRELLALSRWLPTGRKNQKRDDALAMLRAIEAFLAEDPGPKVVDYEFEETEWWLRAQRTAGEIRLDVTTQVDADGHVVSLDELLEELRLEPETDRRVWRAAMLRQLMLVEAKRRGLSLEPELLEVISDAFRRDRGLLSVQSLGAWLRANGLDEQAYGQLIVEEAVLRVMEESLAEVSEAQVENELRGSGDYARLHERAHDKKQVLQALGLVNPGLVEAGVSEAELLRWHVGERSELGWQAAARRARCSDLDAFRRMLLREYCYQRARATA